MTNIFVGNLSYSTTQDELHAAFKAGELDLIYLPYREVGNFLDNPAYAVSKYEGGSIGFLLSFNMAKPPMDNADVRRAIHFDRAAETDFTVALGEMQVAHGVAGTLHVDREEDARAGGDDHLAAPKHRRDKVSVGFARARAGLDDDVALIGDGAFDGFGHGELPFAELVGGVPLGKQSLAAEELADCEWFGCGRHLLDNFSSRSVNDSFKKQ